MKRLKTSQELEKQSDECAYRRSVYEDLGLKLYSSAWAEAELTDEISRKILTLLEHLEKNGEATMGSGFFHEEPTEEELQQAQWFVVSSSNGTMDDEVDIFADPPTCKASRLPRGVHLTDDYLVSERFKSLAKDEKWTGLEFLWAEDKGRYLAMQWYVAVATKPILKPVDHPWYDVHKDSNAEKFPYSAESDIHWDTMREDWSTGSDIQDELISKFPKEILGFKVYGLRRFLKEGLPDTDFAFVSEHKLAFTRRVWSRLEMAGLLNRVNVEPLILLDGMPVNHRVIPDDPGGPSPRVPLKRLPDLKNELTRKFENFANKELPLRKANLKVSLSLLRKAKKENPDEYSRGVFKKTLEPYMESLPHPLPESWQKVLSISNGGTITSTEDDVCTCEYVSIQDLGDYHLELEQEGMDADDDYPTGYLNIAGNGRGDYYALDLTSAKKDDKDCPMVLFDHEENEISLRWESVAEFLEMMLT